MASNRIRVLLVDDHRLVAESLSRVLAAEPDMLVVGVAGSVAEARDLARQRMDIVLMDYRLPDGTGAEATRDIKRRWPTARVIMLTGIHDDETVLESIQAGADGYLTKDGAIRDVVDAVRRAHEGETLLPGSVVIEIARRVALAQGRSDDRPAPEPMTARQREVLGALAEGLSSPQICERLGISRNTLRTHVQEMMARLHAHSKLEAVAIGLRYHLIVAPGGPPA